MPNQDSMNAATLALSTKLDALVNAPSAGYELSDSSFYYEFHETGNQHFLAKKDLTFASSVNAQTMEAAHAT